MTVIVFLIGGALLDRVGCVRQEVEKRLRQLAAIGCDQRELPELSHELRPMADFVGHHLVGSFHDIVELDPFHLVVFDARKCLETLGNGPDVGHPGDVVLHHAFNVLELPIGLVRLEDPWGSARTGRSGERLALPSMATASSSGALSDHREVDQDIRGRVVDLMSYPRGKLSDGGEAVRVDQLLLQVPFELLTLGDVAVVPEMAKELPRTEDGYVVALERPSIGERDLLVENGLPFR